MCISKLKQFTYSRKKNAYAQPHMFTVYKTRYVAGIQHMCNGFMPVRAVCKPRSPDLKRGALASPLAFLVRAPASRTGVPGSRPARWVGADRVGGGYIRTFLCPFCAYATFKHEAPDHSASASGLTCTLLRNRDYELISIYRAALRLNYFETDNLI